MKKGYHMSRQAKQEYFGERHPQYARASKKTKRKILDEICRVCGYNRTYAIRKLNAP